MSLVGTRPIVTLSMTYGNLFYPYLSKYHGSIRKDLLYIYGDARLWYIKKDIDTNQHILKRNSITLIFAVFHWLSEAKNISGQTDADYHRSSRLKMQEM